MRVAVVDLGTNTTRLLIADVEDGHVHEVVRRTRITRLGEGVDARRRLLPLPVARVRNCLAAFRRELEDLHAERVLAVATSAIRDAENGEAFLGEVEWSYGFKTRLLKGDEEAELAFRGVAGERELGEETLVVDIGGGSTELIEGDDDGVSYHISTDLGSVRLTERFLASDPPADRELAECADAVRSLLAERVPDHVRARAGRAIGVAGTVTSLAALDLGIVEYDPERVHGHGRRAARTACGAAAGRAAEGAGARAGAGARHRRRRGDPARGAPPFRARRDRGQRARPAPRSRARGGQASGARRGRRPAGRLHLLLAVRVRRVERLVLGEAPLKELPREHADEAAPLDDRHALGVMLLEEPERLLEAQLRVERVVRLLGDLADRRAAGIPSRGDDLAHERLPRDDADESPLVADEDRAHLGTGKQLPRLLGRRRGVKRPRLGDHRLSNPAHG